MGFEFQDYNDVEKNEIVIFKQRENDFTPLSL